MSKYKGEQISGTLAYICQTASFFHNKHQNGKKYYLSTVAWLLVPGGLRDDSNYYNRFDWLGIFAVTSVKV